jgi:hypothetical protein
MLQTKPLNELQQESHKARPLLVKNDFVRDCLRKNNKAAVEVDVANLNKSQVKSLQCLQKQVGERKLVLSKFSRCHAEEMYQQSGQLAATFGGKNAIPAPQKINFLQDARKKAMPLIAKNDRPKDFKLLSRFAR